MSSLSLRRGSVLLAVMIVIAMAALAATTAMYLAQAELAASRTAMKRTQARALAWSGVQAVMAEMADQREQLLDGAAPELTRQWELFAEEGGPRGIVRLVPWGEDGPVVQSENARLDLNTATAEMLGKLGLDEKTVTSIVAARGASKFTSVGDLRRVSGFDAGLLEPVRAEGEVSPPMTPSHPAATPTPSVDGPSSDASASTAVTPAPAAPTLTRGLAELVTVFSFDPNTQCGLGNNGGEHRGKLRINLQTPWSDRLASAVEERFGPGSSAGLKSFFDGGAKFKSMSDVVGAARQVGLPPETWAPVLDAFTITEDPFIVGCVDLNRASAAVLAAVPGISPAAADQIVQARDGLDSEARRSIVWPLVQGILKAEEFGQAVDHLTSRSMQWRVRVEAGIAPPADSSKPEGEAVPLSDRVVLEAVIDVASERPRVAYLREVTMERAMAAILADAASKPQAEGAEDTRDQPVAPDSQPRDAARGNDLDLSTDLDLSSGMDRGAGDLNLGGSEPSGPIESGSTSPGAATQPAPSGPAPGVDRRVGRWTTGPKGGGG